MYHFLSLDYTIDILSTSVVSMCPIFNVVYDLIHSMQVASFEEYTRPLIQHLYQVKLLHWDRYN